VTVKRRRLVRGFEIDGGGRLRTTTAFRLQPSLTYNADRRRNLS